jgi:thioredoxin 2
MSSSEMIRCPACGATNRVGQPASVKLEPVCGRCKTPLRAASQPLTVSDATFSTAVEQSPLPVLLDFWAPWCPPCRVLAPVIDQLATEMSGRLRVAKLNIDDNPLTASRFHVQSIPTLLVFQGGREVDRLVGALPKAEIVRRLSGFING